MADCTSFDSLTAEFLEAFYEANPARARAEGLHAYDGRLADLSRGGRERRAAELEELLDRLTRAAAPEAREIERSILLAAARFELFRLREWKEWARVPSRYLDEMGVSRYVTKDYAPPQDRVMALRLHLEGVPRLLDEARENLEPILDRTLLETSRRRFEGFVSFVENDLEAAVDVMVEGDADLRRALFAARRQAAEATRDFLGFLDDRRGDAVPDAFAIGAERFATMLRCGEAVEIPLDRLLEVGERDLERNREALLEASRRIDPNADPAEVVERIKADHPAQSEVLDATRRVLDDLRSFVESRGLATIPGGSRCVVAETPSYARFAFAMIDCPGSLEEKESPGVYYVTPPADDWDAEATESWLREFSHPGLAITSAHEAWPGHFLHSLHIRRNPSRVVKSFPSYSAREGWAHYAEELLVEGGYADGSPALHLMQLTHALARNVRLVVAIRMHTRGMTVDEAARLFREEALLGEAAARTEAERGAFDPGYANYTLGKLMLRKLREDVRAVRGGSFSTAGFHDELLAWGAAPIPLVRERMLREPAGEIVGVPAG